MFGALQDDEGTPNQGAWVKVDTATLPDTTPPVFVASPSASDIEDYRFTVSASLDEASTLYLVVVAAGDAAPSTVQVVAGLTAAGQSPLFAGSVAAPANTASSITVTSGIVPDTSYSVYVVAVDATAQENAQTSPTVASVTSGPDATAPTFITSFPNVVSVLDESFSINIQLDEPGTAHCVVLAMGDAAPSAAQVRAGTNAADAAALFSGNVAADAASSTVSIDVSSGVVASTQYVTQFVSMTPKLQPLSVVPQVPRVLHGARRRVQPEHHDDNQVRRCDYRC